MNFSDVIRLIHDLNVREVIFLNVYNFLFSTPGKFYTYFYSAILRKKILKSNFNGIENII